MEQDILSEGLSGGGPAAAGRPPLVQRHQLDVDQLDRIEDEPEVFPVQRVTVDPTSDEHERVLRASARIEGLIAPAIREADARLRRPRP
jgi:hypothetical protein